FHDGELVRDPVTLEHLDVDAAREPVAIDLADSVAFHQVGDFLHRAFEGDVANARLLPPAHDDLRDVTICVPTDGDDARERERVRATAARVHGEHRLDFDARRDFTDASCNR